MANTKTAKDEDLPGTRDRIKPLDDICATIADARAAVNEGQAIIKAQAPTCIRILRQHGKKSWTAHGVRLTLNEGHDTLGIKVVAEPVDPKK